MKNKYFPLLNDKGVILDVVAIFHTILAVVITLIIAVVIFNNYRTAFVNDLNYTSPEINNTFEQAEYHWQTFDKLFFPLLVMGLIVALIISSFFIPSHPIFVVINVLGMVLLAFVGIIIREVYNEIIIQDVVSGPASSLVFTPAMMQMLPFIGIVVVVVATIIGYSKSGGGTV